MGNALQKSERYYPPGIKMEVKAIRDMLQDKIPLVSVVIPCYNYGQYVGETVKSALGSTYPNIEVVIVNDGSTDRHTLEVLKELAKTCTVIHQPNMGLPAARNAGINASRGKYVLPLDADDLIAGTLIEIGVWLLEEHPEYSYIYSGVRLFGTQNYTWDIPPYNFYELLMHNIIPATSLLRKNAWAAVNGYDENMRAGYEDWDFWIRLGRSGHTGYKIEDNLFFYRKHGPSMLSESNRGHDALVKYVKQKNRHLYANPLVQAKMSLVTLSSMMRRHLSRFKFYNRLTDMQHKLKMKNKDVHYLPMATYQRITREDPKVERKYNPAAGAGEKVSVLIILPWLEVGGVEQVFYNIISGLDRDKLSIYIATTLKSTNLWKEKFIPITDGVFILSSFVKDYHHACGFILDLINNKSISVVHISNSKLGYYMAPRIKNAFPGIKIIDLLHMDEPDRPWDYFRVSDMVKQYLDLRVVLTNYFKQLLVEKSSEDPRRVAVIPNGIDLSPFAVPPGGKKKARIQEGVLQIAFVGRMHLQKQPLKFLHIAHRLVEQKAAARFIMIGDGPLYNEVKSYIKKHNLHKSVQLLGFRNDVSRLLAEEIDLLIAPSQREGLPVIGIEALAAGVPIIASDVPGWNELVLPGINGFLAPENNQESFVHYCRYFLDDRLKVLAMGQVGKELVFSKYNRCHMAAAYQDIYVGR